MNLMESFDYFLDGKGAHCTCFGNEHYQFQVFIWTGVLRVLLHELFSLPSDVVNEDRPHPKGLSEQEYREQHSLYFKQELQEKGLLKERNMFNLDGTKF